jgi:hypothetical protein
MKNLFKIPVLVIFIINFNCYSNDTCGLSGSIERRIQHCNHTTKDGNFKLISRSAIKQEVYLQVSNNLVWSDMIIYTDLEPLTLPQAPAAEICANYMEYEQSGLKVDWTLPSKRRFIKALEENIVENLPNFYDKNDNANGFWSSTKNKEFDWTNWVFINSNSSSNYFSREVHFSVRCVAPLN